MSLRCYLGLSDPSSESPSWSGD